MKKEEKKERVAEARESDEKETNTNEASFKCRREAQAIIMMKPSAWTPLSHQ